MSNRGKNKVTKKSATAAAICTAVSSASVHAVPISTYDYDFTADNTNAITLSNDQVFLPVGQEHTDWDSIATYAANTTLTGPDNIGVSLSGDKLAVEDLSTFSDLSVYENTNGGSIDESLFGNVYSSTTADANVAFRTSTLGSTYDGVYSVQCGEVIRGAQNIDRAKILMPNLVASVSEPVTLGLLGAGLAGLAAMRRRKIAA